MSTENPPGPQRYPIIHPAIKNRSLHSRPPQASAYYLPPYVLDRRRWGDVYDDSLLPLLSNVQNPALPSFSLNAPLGSDFQNWYPQLYNTEKSALATMLGSLNPDGTATTAFKQHQWNNEIYLTINVARFTDYLNWYIIKDNPSLPSWAIVLSTNWSAVYFAYGPANTNYLTGVTNFDYQGNITAGNYPPGAVPVPGNGGWYAPGVYYWTIPSWVHWIKVYVTAAGGGGGAGYRGYSGANGGSAGGSCFGDFVVDPLTANPAQVVVGGGGWPGAYEGTSGYNGQNSSFLTQDYRINLVAAGGIGGWAGGYHFGGDVEGGTGYGGVWNTRGGTGKAGSYVWVPDGYYVGGGGSGGDSMYQGGGQGSYVLYSNIGSYPAPGIMGGGGGGGGSTGSPGSQTWWPGAYGGDGVVMVEYFA